MIDRAPLDNRPLDYRHGETALQGVLVRGRDALRPNPAVLLIHEFMGIGGYLLPHADRLARAGFTVLICDMFGKEVRLQDPAQASRLSAPFKADRHLMRDRARAGLDALAAQDGVDTRQMFALGLSFGGCCALELARSGAPLAGTISIYGYLNTPFPARKHDIRGRVLVQHGMRDKVVSMAEVHAFCEEMHRAEADCRVTIHSDAGHGFCNRTVRPDPATGNAYCARTEQRVWTEIMNFLNEKGKERADDGQ